MSKINLHKFDRQSFVDYNVNSVEVSLRNKKISIKIDGAVLVDKENNSNIHRLNDISIIISGWSNIKIYFEDEFLDVQESKNISQYLHLNSICEFIYSKSCLVIRGYTNGEKSGWLDLTLTDPKVTIYGE